jgi:N-sulfoglucosamine sulfohydrolase
VYALSRGAILTGQEFWRLEEGGNLWSTLPEKFEVFPDLLEKTGYRVGFTRKGWGPSRFEPGGRKRNPAGSSYGSFEEFFKTIPEAKPFYFWFGSQDPHRPYEKGSGLASGKQLSDARVPPFLPDTSEVRADILDYYFEIERFDREVGAMLKLLEGSGRLENTLVVITSDNGMPFPRGKANAYDYGARLPLAIRWPRKVKGGRVIEDFISFIDYAPTFLEAVGLRPTPAMTGRSFLGLLTSGRSGRIDSRRDQVFIGRERHAFCRKDNVGYPCRAIRTHRYLYIRNFEPDRWPAGDPERYGDIDGGPTKTFMMEHRSDPNMIRFFQMALEKRPSEELYDLSKDPGQLNNVAALPEYAQAKKRLRADLERRMAETNDPRVAGKGDFWDRSPYYGAAPN